MCIRDRPRMAVCLTLLLYVYKQGSISASKAFYVSSLFEFLNLGALVLPILIVQWSQLCSSLDRIMKLIEIPDDFQQRDTHALPPGKIELKDASFQWSNSAGPVSYTHLRAHETVLDLVCRLLLEKKKNTNPHNHLIL
eukprot:TRINITY_DN2770_c0_g1_i1.p1 TRINITY_DN2770_c0_g1~~TRINITY_DN2770_c0_g1_i1.p1  ORF type:complete len:138 (-),score=45.56 TRINITY_DN2770_c0_g1_i1:8-421(-)